MNPQSEKDYIADHVKLAETSLAEHQILYRDANKITVGKPKSSTYRCDILLSGAYLIMVGDCDTMVFAHYDGRDIEGAIKWMARADVSYYVKQKAAIGMGSIGHESFDLDVALWEAKENLRDAEEDEGNRSIEGWRKIVRELETRYDEYDDRREALNLLYTTLADYDHDSFGMVPSQRLLWAWSIIRKAHELLGLQTSARTL
jgi:hypothetical protein